MFGYGLNSLYGSYTIDAFGGMSGSVLAVLVIRLLVGIGWYRLFDRAGTKPLYAFIPFLGEYTAFHLVWDDFSLSAIFAGTTFVAAVTAMGVDGGALFAACSVLNFVLWWIMALLTSVCFQTSFFLGLVYGSIPWLGTIVMGFWPAGSYKGPWSSDPDSEQNLSSAERKKRRKKAAKAARRSSRGAGKK